jgi:CheY-like chemotaxis protein
MSRVSLIHWNAEERKERAAQLRRAGHTVHIHSGQGAAALRSMRAKPPEVFVIDLSRVPSQSAAVGVWLRQQKATRHIPIVFVAGESEKVARVRKQIPDAVYAQWRGIRGALQQAMAKPPKAPVVPGTMDGYSGTPLPKKLGIKEGSVVALLGAPSGFEKTLGALPEKVRIVRHARGEPNVILLFAKSKAELVRRFPTAARSLADGGRLWMVWPKKRSGVATDLTQTVVRKFGLDSNFVDYKISAIDATWSGLCFARRGSGA